jgi:Ni/Co efflux regulator RcnB
MTRFLLAALVVSAPLAWSAAPAAAAATGTEATGQHQVHRTVAKRHATQAQQHRRVAHTRRAPRTAQPG